MENDHTFYKMQFGAEYTKLNGHLNEMSDSADANKNEMIMQDFYPKINQRRTLATAKTHIISSQMQEFE